MVGGQAVIEGVMMRVPGAYATAVRSPEGDIKTKHNFHVSIVEKYQMQKFIIIRGFFHLIDSMKIGYRTLDWSSAVAESHAAPKNKLIDYLMSIVSILFAIFLFMGIPYYLTEFSLQNRDIASNYNLLFNILAGFLRIIIFVSYLYILSHLKDIKILFQYHGAEHKTVYNFESGKELNIDNAIKFSTLHPRCGTSFMFIIMIVTIISYSLIDTIISYSYNINLPIYLRIGVHLFFLPFVAGIGYEVLKLFAKKQNNILFKSLSKPGLWLQKITTQEPNKEQLEVAIQALKTAFGPNIKKHIGKKYSADAIG